MSLAEVQGRLNVSLRDLVTMFEGAGCAPRSIDMLNKLITDKQFVNFLSLCESYGQSMAFVDHDELVRRLVASYTMFIDCCTKEIDQLWFKKLKPMKEDKKADQEMVAKLENNLADLNIKRANGNMTLVRLKAMATSSIEAYKASALYDPMPAYLAWKTEMLANYPKPKR